MKKIFLILFSLIMMFSISFALEPDIEYSGYYYSAKSISGCSIGSYSSTMINNILQNYYSDSENENYKSSFEGLVGELETLGYNYVIYESNGRCYLTTNILDYDTQFLALPTSTNNTEFKLGLFYSSDTIIDELGHCFGNTDNCCCKYKKNASDKFSYYKGNSINNVIKTNSNIYQMIYVSSYKYYWDGVNYYYELPEQGDSNEINLTDEEIAEIVERFINSDAYIENAYYNGDYFITYDNLTGYFRGYSYAWNIDLAIEYGNYNEDGEFVTAGTTEGEAWRIRPYEFSGDIFNKFGDWLASKFNTYSFEYFSISSDNSIEPRYIGSLEHNYCSNYVDNEFVIYSSKQIRYVGEETNSEGKTETVVTDNYIPPTVLKDSVTGEEIIIRDNLQSSSDSLENVITPNADFSGLKEAFEKYISFVNISSITWLTTAISSMITIFIPFVALGIIIFLINRILNGGS